MFAGFLTPGGGGGGEDSSFSASPNIGNAEAADILTHAISDDRDDAVVNAMVCQVGDRPPI